MFQHQVKAQIVRPMTRAEKDLTTFEPGVSEEARFTRLKAAQIINWARYTDAKEKRPAMAPHFDRLLAASDVFVEAIGANAASAAAHEAVHEIWSSDSSYCIDPFYGVVDEVTAA